MSPEFKDCLARGKIKDFAPGKNLAPKELRLAEDDLRSSQKSFSESNFKWSIIQSYYSMFHSARALLYWKSYREKSHFCLIEAIRFLSVGKKELNKALLEAFIEAKNLRESADYYGDFSEINAQKLIKKGDEFLKEARKLARSLLKMFLRRRDNKYNLYV